MDLLESTALKRLYRQWRRRGHQPLALILDRVQNPFNVGAIVRTAAAQRVNHLYLGAATPPDIPKASKTAMGTTRYLTWSQFDKPEDAVAAARIDNYRIVGVELASNAQPLHEINLTGAVALAFGNENRGLSSAVLEDCDAVGFIPQLGKVGSLNVAAAAAIAIYEVRRQGWTTNLTDQETQDTKD